MNALHAGRSRNLSSAGSRAITPILAGVVLLLLWRFYIPPDTIYPAKRSQRSSVPVAFSQQQRAAEIRREVRDLLEKIEQVWATRFPNEPMGTFNPPRCSRRPGQARAHCGSITSRFRGLPGIVRRAAQRAARTRGNFYSSAALMP